MKHKMTDMHQFCNQDDYYRQWQKLRRSMLVKAQLTHSRTHWQGRLVVLTEAPAGRHTQT